MESDPTVTSGGASKPSIRGLLGQEVARYVWCRQHVVNDEVLDIGCGYGYGTHLLAETAKRIIGVDTDRGAISYAKSHYNRENLEFELIESVSNLGCATFDAVVALEVIEHVTDPKSFISDLCRVLRPNGKFIMSTPNRLFTEKFYKDGKSPNPYHIHEFYPEEIQQLLRLFFGLIDVYAQVYPDAGDMERLVTFASNSKVPKRIRLLVPRRIKNLYLRWKGIPPILDSHGKWEDYPVVACDSVGCTYPDQLYRCVKTNS